MITGPGNKCRIQEITEIPDACKADGINQNRYDLAAYIHYMFLAFFW